ncbi:hypothetical protein Fmac_018475 [Flemingia macrophylla]|uniref:Uncharacterized protein n=1 Tax=Flemingia macrophylla TaxID=520843 RepID=A0ABD1M530_9FABA
MMLQCLEWEPSGSFYQSSVSKLGQNGAAGTSRISYIQDIANPTLQKNPRKVVLYRPSLTHFIAPLPFQPGASFGAVIVGNAQSNSTLGSGLGLSYFPKAYDVVP